MAIASDRALRQIQCEAKRVKSGMESPRLNGEIQK